jgi:hypothetical protein
MYKNKIGFYLSIIGMNKWKINYKVIHEDLEFTWDDWSLIPKGPNVRTMDKRVWSVSFELTLFLDF